MLVKFKERARILGGAIYMPGETADLDDGAFFVEQGVAEMVGPATEAASTSGREVVRAVTAPAVDKMVHRPDEAKRKAGR